MSRSARRADDQAGSRLQALGITPGVVPELQESSPLPGVIEKELLAIAGSSVRMKPRRGHDRREGAAAPRSPR